MEARIIIKCSKFRVGVQDVEVLGHRVTQGGLIPSDGRVEVIENLKIPENVT